MACEYGFWEFVFFAVYKKMEDAMTKHRDADVLVNFASLRSGYESTMETMNYPQVLPILRATLISTNYFGNNFRSKLLRSLPREFLRTWRGNSSRQLNRRAFQLLAQPPWEESSLAASKLETPEAWWTTSCTQNSTDLAGTVHEQFKYKFCAYPFAFQRGIRLEIWWHVQRTEQHHLQGN